MKKRVCSNKIKSSFALLMAMVMLLGASVYTVSAEGSDPSSDVGEPLYTVNFNGDSRFSPDFTNANVNASKEISSDGRSLPASHRSASGGPSQGNILFHGAYITLAMPDLQC